MKLNKKARKKLLGMNSATKRAFKLGHKAPVYMQEPPVNGIIGNHYIKFTAGIPYVNPENFK
jgi:hypothetical protein